MSGSTIQKFSIFHDANEAFLKQWHRPYAELFKNSERVLDVGCGPMYFADLLRDLGVQTIGLDLDPEMVELARKRGHEAIEGDHSHLSNFHAEFGGVHVSHVVEHLWGDQLIVLLEGAYQSLRPGGLLVLRTPNWENRHVREHLFWMDHTHKRPYPRELLTRMLADIGFVPVDSGREPFGVNDSFVVAVKPPVETLKTLTVQFAELPRPSLVYRIKRRLRRKLRLFLELE